MSRALHSLLSFTSFSLCLYTLSYGFRNHLHLKFEKKYARFSISGKLRVDNEVPNVK